MTFLEVYMKTAIVYTSVYERCDISALFSRNFIGCDTCDAALLSVLNQTCRRHFVCLCVYGKMPPKKRKKKIVPEDERFQFMSDEQHKKKREDLKNTNTLKADKKAAKTFQAWLTQRGIHSDYWDIQPEDLDQLLGKFYFEVRTVEGERYKISSLGDLRYGINRNLAKKDYPHDIVHSAEFAKSSAAFTDACKELKSLGKGDRESYKEITPKGNYNVMINLRNPKYKSTQMTLKMQDGTSCQSKPREM